MAVDFDRLMALFSEATEQHPPEEWDAFLDRACGDDRELHRQLQQLLAAHVHGGSLLDKGPIAAQPTITQPLTDAAGTVIGPYKLLQKIGEGGMGVVYMAEQTDPVERRVALKIIKPGLDTRQVIARFEAERQALAMMDHPNIAKVLDAGATEAGRPYFVMELVKGVPITEYCDTNQLTPRERLGLFASVCRAVQHAHQKGVIHRDLKPSNVLVTLHDGTPVAKVIDFGVAKAVGQQLTEKTMFTAFGQVIGTIEYMSPEHAKLNQLDIDTRSDIYSLGVLLYELLTGTTPLDRKRLHSAAFDEMLRIIREEEPPRPSTRLSDLSRPHAPREEPGASSPPTHGLRATAPTTLASIAAKRHLEPSNLPKLLRGELDWIVMKCLEKDRTRRYETATSLAQDIQRYLNDEPVEACPPSSAYRFSKFLRRNKVPVMAASLALLTLMAGITGTTWGLLHADQNRRKAESALAAETEARQAERQARDQAMAALRSMTDEIVQDQLTRLAEQDRAALSFGFAFGLLFALWSASKGVQALFQAMNVAYGEEEKRGFLRFYLTTFAFTLGAILMVVLFVAAIAVVPLILGFAGLGGAAEWAIRILRWVLLFVVAVGAVAVLQLYGPSRRRARWRWVSWGSLLTVAVWLATSIAFSWYLANFGNYHETYGSLGAAIGFLMWLWVSVFVLIAGAELNSEIEHQTAEDSTIGRDRPLGARGAAMADTVGAARRQATGGKGR